MAARILVIEDEERLAAYLQLWLEQVGYSCAWCASGAAGLKEAIEWQPDLVILDLALPGLDGWEVCRRLRQTSQVPIIMVTARGEEMDRVRGLKMGADDYVVKPFSLPELVARVEAVLRRASPSGRERPVTLFHTGGLDVDLEDHKVWVDSREVRLTPTEFRLLAYMIQHQGRLLTHRQILQAVWGPGYIDDSDGRR
ncbi:MAG: response regulator transcription factor [Chloroflexi bacterium]|nr:response regulator transcription factor [Chloroflexota bacterium]